MSGYVYIYILCIYIYICIPKKHPIHIGHIQRWKNTIITGTIKQTHPWRNAQTMKLWTDLSSSISFNAIDSRFLLVPPLKFSLPFQSFHVKIGVWYIFCSLFFPIFCWPIFLHPKTVATSILCLINAFFWRFDPNLSSHQNPGCLLYFSGILLPSHVWTISPEIGIPMNQTGVEWNVIAILITCFPCWDDSYDGFLLMWRLGFSKKHWSSRNGTDQGYWNV